VGDEVIFDSSVTTAGRTITQNVAAGVILSRLVFDSTGGERPTTINNNAIIFEAATPGGFAELYATGNPGAMDTRLTQPCSLTALWSSTFKHQAIPQSAKEVPAI
jgi:hypothetical protein